MKGKETHMIEIRNVIQRLRNGESNRCIHRDLGMHRSIIRDLKELATIHQWLNPESKMPADEEISQAWHTKKQITTSHPLDPYRESIEQWHRQGYSSIVMQRLLKDKFPCDVQVIRRYRTKHFPKYIEPVMVRTTVPGRDLELDFGELGRFRDADGTVKRVWLFSLRLRHSRKAYREIVLDQKLGTFLLGHIHAFEHFNGVPGYCILDNLKAGVLKSTIDNDQLNRSYQELAEHYGFIISPCLPRTPEHKGGVEGDVKYAKGNFLPYFIERQKEMGIHIPLISDLREALDMWGKEVDNVHIVQGVGRSPFAIFQSEEQQALKPLPKDRWERTSWYRYKVRRDWRLMHDSAYYSVPYHLIEKTVEVCVTSSFVRIFYENKEIAMHEKAKSKWEYKRKTEHAPLAQEHVLQCSREGLLAIAEKIGVSTYQLSSEILSHPTVDKLRPVRNLLRLAEKYSLERLERACERAMRCRLISYASVKNILVGNLDQESLELSEATKVVHLDRYRFQRNLNDYRSEELIRKETFEEKLERLHPFSKHRHAMMGPVQGMMADQIMEEYLKGKEE